MWSDIRAAAIGFVAAVASWLTLAVSLGDVGLQRSVAIGPLTLLEQWPALVAMLAVNAAAVAGLVWVFAVERRGSLSVVIGSLAANAFGGFILAPVLVGELEPQHGFTVLSVITGLGIAPLGSLAAAVAVGRRALRQPDRGARR